jgi:RimJ/RimL family protein N-acetyltransferase
MRIWVGTDPGYFAVSARAFLEAKRERIILARIAAAVSAGLYPGATLAIGTEDDNTIVAAAVRTPPLKLVTVGFGADPDLFLDRWLAVDPELRGVSAQPEDAEAIAGAWERRTGAGTMITLEEAMHDLTSVVAPEPRAPGRLRRARARDEDLLAGWWDAFALDTGVDTSTASTNRFRNRIRAGSIYVWEDATPTDPAAPTAMVGHAPPVRGIVNVAPVYTPPEHRGRGYATAATAALSQRLLDEGNERCMLFTDLANPISNHIYAKIGYVRFGSWQEREFGTG